jgi:acyl carrier protein
MEKNFEIYKKNFIDTFGIDESNLEQLKYQGIPEWDSVGHMGLMNSIEESFKIELEIDDIIDFSSFQKGIEILSKYNILFNE